MQSSTQNVPRSSLLSVPLPMVLVGVQLTAPRRYGNLEAALRGPTRLEMTWKQVVNIAMQAAAGILHLHREGVLHRRISSRNILLGDGLRAHVTDFAFSHLKPQNTIYTHTAGTSFMGPGTSLVPLVLSS